MPDGVSQKALLPVTLDKPRSLTVASPAFRHGGSIPVEFTCQGEDVSPPVAIGGAPGGAKALALILDDPDAPDGTFTHWVAWNLPPTIVTLPRGVDVLRLGGRTLENDFGRPGYGGPCPPRGEEHRYFLRLFALDKPLEVPTGISVDRLWREVAAHTLAWGELMGRFKKA